MERYLLDPDPRALARRGGHFWLYYKGSYQSGRTEKPRLADVRDDAGVRRLRFIGRVLVSGLRWARALADQVLLLLGLVLLTAGVAAGGLLLHRPAWFLGVFAGVLVLVILGEGAFRVWHEADARAQAPSQLQSGIAPKLTEAVKVGRRLFAEAGELEPIGNFNRLNDLVRRYNAWEGSVADVLADDDLPSEWRDAWLTDDQSDTFPITREALDRMARIIGERLRLIGQLLRALREDQR